MARSAAEEVLTLAYMPDNRTPSAKETTIFEDRRSNIFLVKAAAAARALSLATATVGPFDGAGWDGGIGGGVGGSGCIRA